MAIFRMNEQKKSDEEKHRKKIILFGPLSMCFECVCNEKPLLAFMLQYKQPNSIFHLPCLFCYWIYANAIHTLIANLFFTAIFLLPFAEFTFITFPIFFFSFSFRSHVCFIFSFRFHHSQLIFVFQVLFILQLQHLSKNSYIHTNQNSICYTLYTTQLLGKYKLQTNISFHTNLIINRTSNVIHIYTYSICHSKIRSAFFILSRSNNRILPYICLEVIILYEWAIEMEWKQYKNWFFFCWFLRK